MGLFRVFGGQQGGGLFIPFLGSRKASLPGRGVFPPQQTFLAPPRAPFFILKNSPFSPLRPLHAALLGSPPNCPSNPGSPPQSAPGAPGATPPFWDLSTPPSPPPSPKGPLGSTLRVYPTCLLFFKGARSPPGNDKLIYCGKKTYRFHTQKNPKDNICMDHLKTKEKKMEHLKGEKRPPSMMKTSPKTFFQKKLDYSGS